MKALKTGIAFLTVFVLSLTTGGYLFSQTQPRSFLALRQCRPCFKANAPAGLLASAGIQKFGQRMPAVVYETDKTIVIKVLDKHVLLYKYSLHTNGTGRQDVT